MTDYPCVADTETVTLEVFDALVPRLRLDADLTNALELRDSGLYAPLAAMPSTRIYQAASQAIGSTAQLAFSSMRWQSANASWGGSNITTVTAGLWLFGASVAFNTGASAGFITVTISPGTGSVPAPTGVLIASDTVTSFGANAFPLASPQTHALNPSGMAYLPAGTAVGCYVSQSFGVSINTAVVEAAGAEFWACLLKAGTV